MRDDMAKMLVETHRTKALYKYKKCRRTNKQQDQEGLPSKEGMQVIYGWDRKSFGENFAPLLGYLKKNVGRKWDDVFSELSKALIGGGAVIDHVYVHLWQYVERKPDFSNGKARKPRHEWYGWRSDNREFGPYEWYVDHDGILRQGKDYPRKKRKVAPKVHFKVDKKEYLKVEGLWYEIKCKELPRLEKFASVKDVVVGVIVGHEYPATRFSPARLNWRQNNHGKFWKEYAPYGDRYAVSKKQLNSRELKKLKL